MDDETAQDEKERNTGPSESERIAEEEEGAWSGVPVAPVAAPRQLVRAERGIDDVVEKDAKDGQRADRIEPAEMWAGVTCGRVHWSRRRLDGPVCRSVGRWS